MARRGAAAWILAALLAAGCRPRGSSYVFLWCADADRQESDFPHGPSGKAVPHGAVFSLE
jgi:hypothetical protein